MFLDIYDKFDTNLGFIFVSDDEYISFCYDRKGNFLGRIIGDEKVLFAFDEDDKLLGRYDGVYTYDKHNNPLKKGNLIYNLFYLTIKHIK